MGDPIMIDARTKATHPHHRHVFPVLDSASDNSRRVSSLIRNSYTVGTWL